jgi:hypothetical protein
MKKITLMLVVPLAVQMVLLLACNARGQGNSTTDIFNKLREAMANLPPAHVYGMVVDQQETPVESAEVEVHWQEVNPLEPTNPSNRKTLIKTKPDGSWDFSAIRGVSVFVQGVDKDGYEFSNDRNPVLRSPEKVYLDRWTTKDNPVVIHLRKKGETTFLLKPRSHMVFFSDESSEYAFDLVQGKSIPRSAERRPEGFTPDLVISGKRTEPQGQWTFVVKTDGPGESGMLLEDTRQSQWEAPAEGYAPEAVIELTPQPLPYIPSKRMADKTVQVTLRTREPAVYGMVTFKLHAEDAAEKCRFDITGVLINPYGSRNFEYETGLDSHWQLGEQLTKEARSELLQKKCPAKPDFPQLIKEAKEKSERDKIRQ